MSEQSEFIEQMNLLFGDSSASPEVKLEVLKMKMQLLEKEKKDIKFAPIELSHRGD